MITSSAAFFLEYANCQHLHLKGSAKKSCPSLCGSLQEVGTPSYPGSRRLGVDELDHKGPWKVRKGESASDLNEWKLSKGQSCDWYSPCHKGPSFFSYFVIKDVHIYCLFYGCKEEMNMNTSSKITGPRNFLSTLNALVQTSFICLLPYQILISQTNLIIRLLHNQVSVIP